MSNTEEIKTEIKQLCDSQSLAVLSTCYEDQPYGSLVGFVASNCLKEIIFATLDNTNKYENISKNAKVALLVDNRNNKAEDFEQAASVTAIGKAEIIEPDQKELHAEFLLEKLPELKEFVEMEHCVLVAVAVEKYVLVNGIHNVKCVEMK